MPLFAAIAGVLTFAIGCYDVVCCRSMEGKRRHRPSKRMMPTLHILYREQPLLLLWSLYAEGSRRQHG